MHISATSIAGFPAGPFWGETPPPPPKKKNPLLPPQNFLLTLFFTPRDPRLLPPPQSPSTPPQKVKSCRKSCIDRPTSRPVLLNEVGIYRGGFRNSVKERSGSLKRQVPVGLSKLSSKQHLVGGKGHFGVQGGVAPHLYPRLQTCRAHCWASSAWWL